MVSITVAEPGFWARGAQPLSPPPKKKKFSPISHENLNKKRYL